MLMSSEFRFGVLMRRCCDERSVPTRQEWQIVEVRKVFSSVPLSGVVSERYIGVNFLYSPHIPLLRPDPVIPSQRAVPESI
jgi:hypothetical protein